MKGKTWMRFEAFASVQVALPPWALEAALLGIRGSVPLGSCAMHIVGPQPDSEQVPSQFGSSQFLPSGVMVL